MTTEAQLVGKTMKHLHEEFSRAIIFRLEDMMTAGIPDICFNYQNLTIWFEAKVMRPSFKVTGLQRVTCSRLHREGFCYFLMYVEKTKAIKLIEPELILSRPWQKAALEEEPRKRYDQTVVSRFIQAHLDITI